MSDHRELGISFKERIARFIIKYVSGVRNRRQADYWYKNQDADTQTSIREHVIIDFHLQRLTYRPESTEPKQLTID